MNRIQINTLATALVILISGNLISQDYLFRVLAKKGETSVSSDGQAWLPLKTGSSLQSGQQIKVGDGAYLGLIHKSGKTFEIKTAGINKINELAQKVDVADAGVASKYADFVMNKMSASDEDINKNHRNYLSATGAVTRGMNDAIKLYLPVKSKFYAKEAMLTWTELEKGKSVDSPTYVLSLSNIFDEIIYTVETKDLKYIVDLSDDKFKNEQIIALKVYVKDSPTLESGQYTIERINPEVSQPIIQELDELKATTKEETAMNKLILASFFEQNNLMMDAMVNYREAMNLAVDVPIFQHAYEQFVLTHGLGTK